MTEQAIVISAHGGPEELRLEDVEVGDPAAGEVRVRHHAIGINFADTYFRTGLYPTSLPTGIGVEAAGVVEAVGSGVEFVVGDRVTYTGSPLGAYSTARVMPADSLVRIPDGVGFDATASLTMRGLTAGYLLRRIWPLQEGDTVLFHAAAGGVGLVFCQWARLLGVRVIGTASTEQKADIARQHGCSEVIIGEADVVGRVRELTEGRGVKVAYDGVGRDTFDTSIRCLARRGLMVCLGTASGPVRPVDTPELVRRGSLFLTRPALADYLADPIERDQLVSELFGHVAEGRILATVNHRYALADAPAAHRALESRSTTGSSIFDLTI